MSVPPVNAALCLSFLRPHSKMGWPQLSVMGGLAGLPDSLTGLLFLCI